MSQSILFFENLGGELGECLFVVYPDSDETFYRYFPSVTAGERRSFPSDTFLGVGWYSPGVLGVRTSIVTIPRYPGDFPLEELEVLMLRIRHLAGEFGSRGVALAGILPSRFEGYKISMEPPCVDGRIGTSYAVTTTLKDVLSIHGMSIVTAPVKVLGIGYVGWSYIQYLRDLGCTNLVGVDPRFRSPHTRGGILFTSQLDVVDEGDIVIFLAGGGYQIDAARLPRIIGINDMYPRFSEEQIAAMGAAGSLLYEVALATEGVESSIVIEQFPRNTFPGCLAQALVEATGVRTKEMNRRQFDEVAERLRIYSPYHSRA